MNARSGGELRRAAVAAAVLVACGPLWAAEGDEEMERLTKPQSALGAGIGVVSDNNTRFGQYNGMTEQGAYGLIDVELRKRDDASGTWFNLIGRNLGLESGELRLEHQRQGNWGYFLDYSQTPRYSPYTALTRLTGIGTSSLTVNGAATPYELEMKTLRQNFSVGFDKLFAGGYNVALRFRNEEKEGSRLFGRSGTDFLVDPVDYTTQVWEASGGYAGKAFQWNAAYFGTNFNNNKPRLDIAGGTGTTYNPIALPPANQSHQLSLAGGYNFTNTTRGNFKVAYTLQTQSDAFIDTPAAATGRTDLGGKVETTFAQLGLSSRPTKDLSLLANLRYEDRDDQTPVVDYFVVTTGTTYTGENEPRSIRTLNGKLEGLYRLGMGFSAVAGVEYEEKNRNTSPVRVVSYRETTEEAAFRAELRRAMSETVNGSLAYIYSTRTGSPWQTTVLTTGAAGSNLTHPLHLADRDRNMVRAKLNWAASERLDLQFIADYSQDEYSGRSLGLTEGKASHYAVDAGLRLSDAWQATAWVSQDELKSTQTACEAAVNVTGCPNTAADPTWQADLRNTGTALGAGLRGKPGPGLDLRADLQYGKDRGEFRQAPLPNTLTASAALPDTQVERITFRLEGAYAYARDHAVRFVYIYDHFESDDWTWTNYTYSDGTRILPNPIQKVHFIGMQLLFRL